MTADSTSPKLFPAPRNGDLVIDSAGNVKLFQSTYSEAVNGLSATLMKRSDLTKAVVIHDEVLVDAPSDIVDAVRNALSNEEEHPRLTPVCIDAVFAANPEAFSYQEEAARIPRKDAESAPVVPRDTQSGVRHTQIGSYASIRARHRPLPGAIPVFSKQLQAVTFTKEDVEKLKADFKAFMAVFHEEKAGARKVEAVQEPYTLPKACAALGLDLESEKRALMADHHVSPFTKDDLLKLKEQVGKCGFAPNLTMVYEYEPEVRITEEELKTPIDILAERYGDENVHHFKDDAAKLRELLARVDVERDDAFQAAIRASVDLIGLRPVSDCIGIGIGLVRRYAIGKAAPAWQMRRGVLRDIIQKIDRGTCSYRTEEDRAEEERLERDAIEASKRPYVPTF